jgi:Beta-galactosidase
MFAWFRGAHSTLFFRIRFSLFLSLCSGICLFGQPLQAAVPKGVFSLSGAGNPCPEKVLQNPDVDGISIRQNWVDLEPSEGAFNWSFLDSEVARAAAAGKQVLLRINTQFSKPAWVTAAVTKADGTFYSFLDSDGVEITIPVFWDPTFLAKKKAMIAALGAHFTNNPAIVIVWASFANAQSEDWSVPHMPSEIEAWHEVGYTTDKLLDAGKQIIDATMTAFPKQYVTLAIAGNGGLDPDPNYAARNAILAARAIWPGRLIAQKNNLATFNPPAPGTSTVFQPLWDSRPDIGGQMLWNCSSDTSYRMNNGVVDLPATILHKSIDAGAAYEMNYFEIYQTDVLKLPDEIAYAHNLLLGLLSELKPPSGIKIEP